MAAAEGITFRNWPTDWRPELRRTRDRRPELRTIHLQPRRSDKCKSWYIAACIAGGGRRDRPASPPARIAAGEPCNTLASPLVGNSDGEHFRTQAGALAGNLSGIGGCTSVPPLRGVP